MDNTITVRTVLPSFLLFLYFVDLCAASLMEVGRQIDVDRCLWPTSTHHACIHASACTRGTSIFSGGSVTRCRSSVGLRLSDVAAVAKTTSALTVVETICRMKPARAPARFLIFRNSRH